MFVPLKTVKEEKKDLFHLEVLLCLWQERSSALECTIVRSQVLYCIRNVDLGCRSIAGAIYFYLVEPCK